jgi:hypothetical protein
MEFLGIPCILGKSGDGHKSKLMKPNAKNR